MHAALLPWDPLPSSQVLRVWPRAMLEGAILQKKGHIRTRAANLSPLAELRANPSRFLSIDEALQRATSAAECV